MAREQRDGDHFPGPDEMRLLRAKAHDVIFLPRVHAVAYEEDRYKFLKEGAGDLYHLEYVLAKGAIHANSDLARMHVESLRIAYTPEHYDPEDDAGKNGVAERTAVYIAYENNRYVHYTIEGDEESTDILTPDTDVADDFIDRRVNQIEALELRSILQAAIAHDA
ncbi:hypothetical protein I8H83_05080 [Candidatus Saccharibacteria bacterium]|nr:hypothetical protein [Candidatus Saccharibacteria bacterium]MBH2007948.1 hypothetical protein [Candidatus Saccharibacteria bacterium]